VTNELITIPGFTPINDPHPESEKFSNIKLYNHLIEHMRGHKPENPRRWCSIECMTKEFNKQARLSKPLRKKSRERLTPFQRWAREEHNKLIEVARVGNGKNHKEAVAVKIFDHLSADSHDRELVAADVNRALHRKEISQETYDKIFQIVYPLLNGKPDEEMSEEQKSE
jgi:hypothetical protein